MRLHYSAAFVWLLRSGTGLLLCLQMLSIWPDFQLFYGLQAPIDLALSSLYSPSPFHVGQLQQFLVDYLGLNAIYAARCTMLCYLALSLLLTVQRYPRLSALLLLALHLSVFAGVSLYSYGLDQISTSALFYCVLVPGKEPANGISLKLYRLVIQLHVCLIYFFAGFGKALGYNWWNGEALWKALHIPYFNLDFLALMPYLQDFSLLFILGGWLVILLETLYPFLIWHPRIGAYWLKATLVMHLAVALLLNLHFFSAFMILLNLTAFYRGQLFQYISNKQAMLHLSRWWRAKDAHAQHPQA